MIRSLRTLLALGLVALSMQLHALEVTISIVATENCSYGNGKLRADVTGGTPPYTYAWSNGSTQQIPTMLSSGNYTVTATDSQGAQASANIFLPSGPFLDSDLATTMVFQTGVYCAGSSPSGPLFNFNQPAWFMFAGVAPFTFDGEPGISWECNSTLAGYLVSLPNAQAGTNVDVAFLDANGCPGTIAVTVGHEVEWPSLNVVNVQPACADQPNGSIQLAIGTEGHDQLVWMQVLDENDNVIVGQNWSYTVGNMPVNLTISNRPAGTYRVMLHIVNNECSPLFGQCTQELEVVIPAESDCTCQNSNLFPNAPIPIISNGQPQTANQCIFFGDYSVFSNVQTGSDYTFTVGGNGYITVRQGAVGGPVIGQGYSPVSITASSNEQLFVHYNMNEDCATSATCQVTTVTRNLNCQMPVASFAATVDCAAQEYTITIDVQSTGDANGVNIGVMGQPLSHADVGAGTYSIGPLSSLNGVTVTVAHTADSDCTLSNSTWQVEQCPVEVICGAAPVQETYCYVNSDTRHWNYYATGAGTLYLRFLRGTIESANFDQLRIYDGQDASAPLLYEHTGSSQNLGPAGSGINNTSFAFSAVEVFSTTGTLFMEMSSDFSVSCSSTTNFDPWEWEVLCGTVSLSGRAFLDNDLDCTWSSSEVVVPQTIIEVLPGPIYTTTGPAGSYFMVLNDGNYTIRQVNPYVIDHCAPTPQPFTIGSPNTELVIDFPDTAATALDLAVSMSSGAARVGFSYQQAVAVQNLSARQSGAITLTLNIPTEIEYTSAEPAPNTVQGTTLVWQLPALGPFQQQSVQVHYQVPVDISLIGTQLATVATVTIDPQEEETGNNSTVHTRTITAAYDPNDKIATTSSGASGSNFYIDLDNWIDYNIRFQNTGNDTAFTVVITDTLPSALNPTTIQMGAASHPFTWELKGPGILEFTFNNIMLPDSFVNEPASHGFVGFRIRPHLPVLLGEEISNTANIFFDFNPPVITEPSVLVAEFWTGVAEHQDNQVLQVFPNPADHLLNIVLSDRRDMRSVEVRSIDGRLVAAERAQGRVISIQVAQLANGPYSIQARDADGRTYRGLFIKQ